MRCCAQRKLSVLRKKLWREAGPPPDLATRLFSERIMYLVSSRRMRRTLQRSSSNCEELSSP